MNAAAIPLESSVETIYILLGTAGATSSVNATNWSGTGLENYIQSKVLKGDASRLYQTSYDLDVLTPSVFASDYIAKAGGKSILDKAVQNWFNTCTNPDIVKLKKSYTNLSALRKARPDVVPSKFVVIADGAAGLAVREYIQSSEYKGEIANVIFFNTPHEGTGFADQAIFDKSNTTLDRGGDASKYAALIPLALVAYLVGGIDGLQDMMISLLKDAVMGMAYSVGDIKDGVENLLVGYSNENASTWYLSQDASESDPLYKNLIGDKTELLGSTQYLNSFSKNNVYDHPAYNIVYSYGLPVIGNGRRTLSDFASQAKNHISKEKLAKVLTDSLKSSFSEDDFEDVKDIANSILENKTVQEVMNDYSEYSEKINDVVKAVQGIEELRKTSFNKDDIPGSVYKLLKIVDTFIPESYKSEIYSLLMEYFTPETREILKDVGKCAVGGGNIKACAKEGAKLMASNLANYSLNFFDEGAFDVPVYSAIGENVAAFKASVVGRLGYGMQDILDKTSEYKNSFKAYENQFEQLKDYRSLLSDVGELETDRKVVDLALNVACTVLNDLNPAYGKICSAAEFATNVTLVGVTSYKIKKLVEKSSALLLTRDAALMASSVNTQNYTGKNYHGDDFDIDVPDIESMLFGSPRISIASVRKVNGSDTIIIPLMFTQACKDGKVFNAASMKTLCGENTNVYEIKASELRTSSSNLSSTEPVTVKDVSYDANYNKTVKYGELDHFKIENFIQQIHFQIDDFQPDSMRWVKLDFNARVQIVYERGDDGNWRVYFEKSYQKGDAVAVLTESPITEDGRLVVKFQDVLDAYNKKNSGDSYGLGGLMEDGNNVIYVAAMNRVGRTYGGMFSFFFKATEFNYGAGWPRDYVKITGMDTVSAFVNNTGYNQYEVKSAGLRVSRVLSDSSVVDSILLSSVSDSVAVVFNEVREYNDTITGGGVTAKEYQLRTSLKNAMPSLDVSAEGEYLLEWDVLWYNPNDATDSSELKFRTYVVVDTTAPKFKLNLKQRSLAGDSRDGIWADVLPADSMLESARAIRGILCDVLGNPVTPVFNKTRHNSKHLEINWNDSLISKRLLTSGQYKFAVQAYDFAVPDSAAYVTLLNINDKKYDLWNYVANGVSFKPGYNGFIIDTTIWIDNAAPRIVDGTVNITAILDTLRKDCRTPSVSGKIVVNSCSQLAVSFDVNEDRLGRGSTDVKVNLLFKDADDTMRVVRDFVDAVTFDTTDVQNYRFEESLQNKLADGVYSLYVELTDETGNVSAKKIADNIVVDRMAPSVYSVNAGGKAFTSVSAIKGSYAYVKQEDGDARLASTLSCYKFLNAAGDTSGWIFVDTLISEKQESRIMNFSIADLVVGKGDGSWAVYLGCYDAAGNFGYGLDFFGVGARYPRITFPNDSINSFYYGRVLVKGVADNPDINGNDNEASFELEWKAEGDTGWHKEGFEYLDYGVNGKERDLAIWNLDSVLSGMDTLRLSVRACSDTTCPWKSTDITVPVYARMDPLHDTLETKIDIDVPSSQKVGESTVITIQLDSTSDTAAWKVESKILMELPGDTAWVEADGFTFDPAVISPFKQRPTSIDSGLYIWQEGNVWNICWKGTPKGVIMDSSEVTKTVDPTYVVPDTVERMMPKLSIKYQETYVSIADSLLSNAVVDSASIPAIEIGGMKVPSFDRNVSWQLDALGGDSLLIQFTTDSAFTVDLSTVEGSGSLIYCGNRLANEAVPTFAGVGTVYVHPEHYKMRHVWKGQGDGGIYAGGTKARIKVIAYNKNDPSRILTKEEEWFLSFGDVELVYAGGVADLYFDLGIPDSVPFKRNEVVLKYGLHGRAAYVTEEVVGPNGAVVKTFNSAKLVYAGEASDANMVSWDGEGADDIVESVLGQYKFRITAYEDAAGAKQVDQLEVPFEMKDNGRLFPADTVTEYSTEFSLDEATEDEYGDLRYVGNIDYLMKTHVSANYLPEEKRKFYYKWEYESSAMQYAAIYRKYRFSAGFHRHRNKFPVTVAVLVVSEGFDVKSERHEIVGGIIGGMLWDVPGAIIGSYYHTCEPQTNRHPYVIKVFRKEMIEGLPVDLDVVLTGLNVVGYNDNGTQNYDIITGVKVMPADVFEPMTIAYSAVVVDSSFEFSGIVEDEFNSGYSIASGIWDDSKSATELRSVYKQGTNLSNWFNNFDDKPIFWESAKYSFKENDAEFNALSLIEKNSLSVPKCVVDNSKDADESKSVCGPKTAQDELDTAKLRADNPHVDMLNVAVKYGLGNTSFSKRNYSAPRGCKGTYSSSGSEVALKFVLNVKNDYWQPKKADGTASWGYNNLANRYVRFDPTNKTLYGDGGYFWSNNDDHSKFNLNQRYAFMNHYGMNGWEYSYTKPNAYLSPFEAERFPMRQTGMNPLLFSDEINAGSTLYPSRFSMTYFSVGKNDKIRVVARVTAPNKVDSLDSDASNANAEHLVGDSYVNPLDVSFTVAPVVSVNSALVNDRDRGVYCAYPYRSQATKLQTLFKQSPYFSKDTSFAFYVDWRSRVHYTVGDWDENDWKSMFVVDDSIARNPVTYDSLFYDYGVNRWGITPKKASWLDTIFVYDVQETDWNTDRWEIPYDSIRQIPQMYFGFGEENGAIYAEAILKEVNSSGTVVSDKIWNADTVAMGKNIFTSGVEIDTLMDYIFSLDSINPGVKDRMHQVPLSHVLAQNGADSLLSSIWVKNLVAGLDSVCERDTNGVDSLLRKHRFMDADYDTASMNFTVKWNGLTPVERLGEIGTFRGRIPGDNAPWTIIYVNNGYTYFVASGVQDTFPEQEPYPVLARFDMHKLQGNTSFFLLYGNQNSVSYYRELDVHFGTRVNPGESAVVQTMLANGEVGFVPGAWGADPIDVTARSVGPEEYVYKTFDGLAVNGPVLEVLPSHDFGEDQSLWPTVKMKLAREDFASVGYDVSRLKIYKPNFEEREILPMEQQWYECFDEIPDGIDTICPCSSKKWDYVFICAKTQTFSSFVVLDTNVANSFSPVDTVPAVDTLHCMEVAMDTIWMGTYNGWLEYPYGCEGRSNYVLQLRAGSTVAAEHKGISSSPIVWNARNHDVWAKADVYTSRADYFGVDGSSEQVAGPFVRIDSIAPVMYDETISVEENGSERIVTVSGSFADTMAGVSRVYMNVYYGSFVVDSVVLSYAGFAKDSSFSESFSINGKLLRDCLGCRVSVDIKVEDAGHNHIEGKVVSEPIYPYPQSLVLWYPMSEGYGNVAHEMMGTGLDLSLNSMLRPWMYGASLYLSKKFDYATSVDSLDVLDSLDAFSVEFRGVKIGLAKKGRLIGWNGGSGWSVGYMVSNAYYFKCGSETLTFSTKARHEVAEHIVISVNGNTVSLYRDGLFMESKNLSSDVVWNLNGKPVYGMLGTDSTLMSRMSDLRIYNSALTAEQVRDLYHYEYVPDEETEKVFVVRAADVEDHDGLVIDQSCALPGKAYLRQKNSASEGWVNWMVDAEAGSYALYLLMRGYTTETSLVEVSVNNVNYGVHRLRSSGLWESVRVGDSLKFSLADGTNFVSVRPVGNVGLAGVAVVSSPRDFDAVKLDFGQAGWQDPDPRVEVRLTYDNYRDTTWARPRVQLRNLTSKSYPNAHFRYFYKGEGSSVHAKSFWPDLPMSVVPDAGDVFYADLTLTEPIAPYGNVYGNDGLQLGLHRAPNYSRWNIFDDPSYAAGAENGYVVANGVALLDEDGVLLNEWQCYDDGQPAEQSKPSVVALAKDESENPWQSSRVRVVVENNGSVAVDGFEVRYYYRDANGKMAKPDYYDFAFADTSFVNVGGDLYYVSFMYSNAILNPGERNVYGNGAQFALHGWNWEPAYFNANDDPSHYGLGRNLAPADSIVVLDRNGNLLWGNVPQPKFADNFVVSPSGESRVTRVGDVVYVEIDETGYYTLETVNAAGMPLAKLFEGTWKPGEYMVQIPADKLNAGGYLVLRKGNVILNWQLLK